MCFVFLFLDKIRVRARGWPCLALVADPTCAVEIKTAAAQIRSAPIFPMDHTAAWWHLEETET